MSFIENSGGNEYNASSTFLLMLDLVPRVEDTDLISASTWDLDCYSYYKISYNSTNPLDSSLEA